MDSTGETNPDKVVFDYAENLIKCSEIDFECARDLFKSEKKHYSAILYHIQQAVEKLAKAELTLRKQLNPKELREVNHRTPNAFMFSLEKVRKDEKLNSFLSPHLDVNAVEKAKGYIKNPTEIKKSDKDTLLKMMNFYDDVFKPLGLADLMFQEALMSPISDMIKENPEERRDVYMRLFFLSWITFFFAEETRYPDGEIKPFEYNETNSFVQIIPDFLNKIEGILKIMKSYKYEESAGSEDKAKL